LKARQIITIRDSTRGGKDIGIFAGKEKNRKEPRPGKIPFEGAGKVTRHKKGKGKEAKKEKKILQIVKAKKKPIPIDAGYEQTRRRKKKESRNVIKPKKKFFEQREEIQFIYLQRGPSSKGREGGSTCKKKERVASPLKGVLSEEETTVRFPSILLQKGRGMGGKNVFGVGK